MKVGDKLPGREETIVCLKPLYLDFNGTRMSNTFTIQKWREAVAYKPRQGTIIKFEIPDDIFIATFPKCGTTWMQEITYLLLNDGNAAGSDMNRPKNNPFIEVTGRSGPENMKRPGCIKTHLSRDVVPYADHAKYIYVVRNPKDCVVSYFYHTRDQFPCYEFQDGKFEDFFELFINGKIEYNDYFSHLLSWYPQTKKSNTILIHYEDLKKNTKDEILRLAKFIGEEYYNKLLSGDLMDKIIHGSSLEAMKKAYAEYEVSEEHVRDEQNDGLRNYVMTNLNKDKKLKLDKFVRKGGVGSYKELITEEMNSRLEDKIRKLESQCPDIVAKWREHGIIA